MKLNIRKFLLLSTFLLISGCVTTNRTPSDLATELNYTQEIKAEYSANTNWWKQYDNEELNRLVETALKNNPDYLKAAVNIDKELYKLGLSTSDLFPTLTAGTNASSQRKIDRKDNFSSNFSGEAGLNYEADLYGKIHNQYQAQKLEYQATAMDHEAARLTLVNSVVDLYFNLEYLQNAINLTEKNIKNYEQIRNVAKAKYNAGKADNVEFLEAEQNLLSEQNRLLDLQTGFKETQTSLKNILAVSNDEKLDLKFGEILNQPALGVNINVPVAVLATRPDLISSQYRLEKAFKNLETENKNWYPNISFKGVLSSSSDKARTTFDFPYILGSVGVDLPFLDWNRVKNNIKISEADYDLTVLEFKDTLNQAVNEVIYYYFAYEQAQKTFENTEKNYKNASQITRYYQERYNSGKTEFKDFLQALSSENSLRKNLLEQKYQLIKYENYVYKSMGGKY